MQNEVAGLVFFYFQWLHGLKEAVLKDCAFAKDCSFGNNCVVGLVGFLYEVLSYSPKFLQAAMKTFACS